MPTRFIPILSATTSALATDTRPPVATFAPVELRATSACMDCQQSSTNEGASRVKSGKPIAENTPNAHRVPQSILEVPTEPDTDSSKKFLSTIAYKPLR